MKNKKYWLLGLVGSLLFGIGDWLLGFVDPAVVNAAFSVIKAGHGADYALGKIAVTLATGALGIPFLMLGCMRLAEFVTDAQRQKRLRFWMMLLPVGWMLIHFTVSVGIYAYSWEMHVGNADAAQRLAMDMIGMTKPAQVIGDFMAGIPLILLLVYVLRGKTSLPKISQLFAPVLWMALVSVIKYLVPASPLSNGLDTFAMNAGMTIWFAYLLIKRI